MDEAQRLALAEAPKKKSTWYIVKQVALGIGLICGGLMSAWALLVVSPQITESVNNGTHLLSNITLLMNGQTPYQKRLSDSVRTIAEFQRTAPQRRDSVILNSKPFQDLLRRFEEHIHKDRAEVFPKIDCLPSTYAYRRHPIPTQ